MKALQTQWLMQLVVANKKLLLDLVIILSLSGLAFIGFKQFNLQHMVENLELIIYDVRFSLASNHQTQKPSKDIVLVVYDDVTLAEFEHLYGTWPWSRQVQANLIHYLHQAGVKTTIFDIMFAGKGKDDKDSSLIEAYQKLNNVYLGYNLTYSVPITLKHSLKPMQGIRVEPYSTQLGWAPYSRPKFLNNPTVNMGGYRPLLKGLMQKPDRLAVINHIRDRDGISRGNPLLYKVELIDDKGLPHTWFEPYLGLKVLLDMKGFNPKKDAVTITADNHLVWKDINVPLRTDGLFLVNWLSSSTSPYTEIPVRLILESLAHGKNQTSNDKVLKSYFKDKIVFVGSTAVSTFDIKTTSINRLFPGVTYQAMLFDNLLNGKQFVHRISPFELTIVTGLICLLGCIFLIRIRSTTVAYLSVVLLGISYIGLTQLLFFNFKLWVDLAQPLLFYLSTLLITLLVKYMSRDVDYQQTYKLATTDSLTGLYNHRYFMEQSHHLIETNHNQNGRFALVLVDIDHFKKFNDTYGHLIGDAVLRAVAQALKSSVRSIDVVARYGGEEMAILLPRTTLEEAVQVANKLVHIIGNTQHNLGPGVTRQVTISAGVGVFPLHGDHIKHLIEHADKGLYLAKGGGRNQVGLAATEAEKHGVKTEAASQTHKLPE
jgi:diguanylate cyclase (GGDEF)-like protein